MSAPCGITASWSPMQTIFNSIMKQTRIIFSQKQFQCTVLLKFLAFSSYCTYFNFVFSAIGHVKATGNQMYIFKISKMFNTLAAFLEKKLQWRAHKSKMKLRHEHQFLFQSTTVAGFGASLKLIWTICTKWSLARPNSTKMNSPCIVKYSLKDLWNELHMYMEDCVF